MRYAIIDLGTNTFHLFVADVFTDGSWQKKMHKRITVKLGQGGISKNIIAPGSYKRGVEALRKFKSCLVKYRIKKVFAFGTAALRNATNGKDFLKEIKKEFGISVNVISGNEEARLIYYGVKQAVLFDENPVIIMDIGGGSVEFIIANNKKVFWQKSFKLGAALLLEKFNPSNPATKTEIRRISSHSKKELELLFEACSKYKPVMLIGSAGSFETFASMIRCRWPETGSHYGKTSHEIDFSKFRMLYTELLGSTRDERLRMKGLIKMRVDMIVLAAILLKLVLDKTGIKRIRLSAYSLKEGALLHVINQKK